MYKNIIFYNHFHNGDIHVSREFVRKISSVLKNIYPEINISYSHKNHISCVADIPEISYNQYSLKSLQTHTGAFINDNNLFINTWYGQLNYHYMNSYGISFDCLYAIFDDVCKKYFNFTLNDIESNPEKWFPTIDFSKYEVDKVRNFLDNLKNRRIVFVCNNKALSGQAHNFPMLKITTNLANACPDTTFILTNYEGELIHSNTIYSSNIIKKNEFDLNENAFISSYCDIIIGRASGPHTFSFIQSNLFEKPKRIICFSNLTPLKENTFWLSDMFRDKVKYTSKIINENILKESEAQLIIERNINV